MIRTSNNHIKNKITNTFINHNKNNKNIFSIPNVKGKNKYINKFIKANIIIFEANSNINNVFQELSSNIASCIIVSSRCVDGLSNGNLLFSAKNIVKKTNANNIIISIQPKLDHSLLKIA